MLNRDSIIRNALRICGESYSYNVNTSDTYRVASDILKEIINDFATRLDLKFNSQTVTLTSDGQNDIGEYRFNLPIDFLNKIRFIGDVTARIESEFVYSQNKSVVLQYCRNISFEEYPDYLAELLNYTLALKLSESLSQFEKKINLTNNRVFEETKKIYQLEFTPAIRVM